MKNNQYVLSIDLGTQGVKTAVLDLNGKIIEEDFAENTFCELEEGEISIEPEILIRSVEVTTKKVISKIGELKTRICCVSVVGMMAGIVGIGDNWEAVTRYDTGLDKRCEEALSEMQAIAETDIIRICGCPVIVAMGAKMYWWKTRRPEIFERVRKFIPASSYIAGYIAGLKADEAYIDYTHIHLTCFADIEKCEWSDVLLDKFDYPKEKMPKIVSPVDIIGETTGEWEKRTGLPAGIRVIAGCGDTAASSLGAGLVRPNMVLDIAGTASCLLACVDRYIPDVDKKIIMFPKSVIPGLWTPFGFVLGGETMSWYLNQINYDGNCSFKRLAEEAAASDKDDLYFLPFFAGRVCPSNAVYSGTWVGMKFYHTRGDMFRSIMTSIGFEYRYYLSRIMELIPEMRAEEIVTSAGGARSEELVKIKADVLQYPIHILCQKDTSHKAGVIMAGYACGIFDDMAQAALSMCSDDYGNTIQPDKMKTEKYEKMYKIYGQIVDSMGTVFDEIRI